jgi:hypothetical protein
MSEWKGSRHALTVVEDTLNQQFSIPNNSVQFQRESEMLRGNLITSYAYFGSLRMAYEMVMQNAFRFNSGPATGARKV